MADAEKVILVGVGLKPRKDETASSLAELRGLAESAGAQVDKEFTQLLERYHPGSLIGSGKIEEITESAKERNVRTIIFDAELSPAQQKFIENFCRAKIIDRTRLILDIFAKRARTSEGRLQVELAQLSYMLPRLTGAWRSYSQQVGGIGTRGPGERQLEYERRHIQRRIEHLKADLEKIRQGRKLRRRNRQMIPLPQIALIGYTNVGKSTLLNSLTEGGSHVYADDKLFATLDPTSRRVRLPGGGWAIATDTVGFIQNLPTPLIAAFRATLEEVSQADCLFFVSDASAPDFDAQEKAVIDVLNELGAGDIPRVHIFNKIDLLGPSRLESLRRLYPERFFISALQGEGIRAALSQAQEVLSRRWLLREIDLPDAAARHMPDIYRSSQVISREYSSGKTRFLVRITAENWRRIERRIRA